MYKQLSLCGGVDKAKNSSRISYFPAGVSRISTCTAFSARGAMDEFVAELDKKNIMNDTIRVF